MELKLNKPQVIIVPAKAEWFKTEFMLKKDHVYKFEVLPNDQIWTDGRWLGDFTADGKASIIMGIFYPFARMPFKKWFSLLGCIDKKRSSYFKIGTRLENYGPEKDGELICFANDVLGFYEHNNKGEMKLTITRIK